METHNSVLEVQLRVLRQENHAENFAKSWVKLNHLSRKWAQIERHLFWPK